MLKTFWQTVDLEYEPEQIIEQISEVIDMIDPDYSDSQEIQMMYVRGLFMLLSIEHLCKYQWLPVSMKIVSNINKLFEEDEDLPVSDDHFLMSFLKSIKYSDLSDYLMKM